MPLGFVTASSSRGHVWDRPLSHLSPPRGSLPFSNPKQDILCCTDSAANAADAETPSVCWGGADVWKEKKGKGCMEGGGGLVFLKKAWSKKSSTGGGWRWGAGLRIVSIHE